MSQELTRVNDRIDALVKRVQALEEVAMLLRDNQRELIATQRESLRLMKQVLQQAESNRLVD